VKPSFHTSSYEGDFRVPETLLITNRVSGHDPESHNLDHDLSRGKQVIDMNSVSQAPSGIHGVRIAYKGGVCNHRVVE
jgi:hypothetical protein